MSVLLPSIRSLEDSSADIPIAAAVVKNAYTAEEEANFRPVLPNTLKTSKEESLTALIRGEADGINKTFSSSSDCNLFKLDRTG